MGSYKKVVRDCIKQFGPNGKKANVVLPVEKELLLLQEIVYKVIVLGKVPRLKIVKQLPVQV